MSGDRDPTIVRPTIPPSLWAAVGVWIGIVAAEAVAWRTFPESAPPALMVIPIVAVIVTCVLMRRKTGSALMCGAMAVGLAVGFLFWSGYARDVDYASTSPSVGWEIAADDDPSRGRFGFRTDATVITPFPGRRLRCLWPENGPVPELGQRVGMRVRLRPPAHDEFGRRMHRAGTIGSVSPSKPRVLGWGDSASGLVGPARLSAKTAIDRVPGVGGALLSGVVIGDRRRLDETAASEDFRITGLTHLVAISGGHLVVVAALVSWLLGRLPLHRMLAKVTALAFMAAYVVATGVQPSAVRALVMSTVVVWASGLGRRGDALSGLSLATLAMLLADPPVAFDVGFQLSVTAVAGLLLFSRLAEAWVASAVPGRLSGVAAPLAMTVVAQIATAPVVVGVFGVVSLIAPIANILVGPLISVVLFAGLAGLAVSPLVPGLGHWLLMVGGAAGELSADIAGRMASVPGASVAYGGAGLAVCVCLCAMVALWVLWPRPERVVSRVLLGLMLAVCLVAAVGPPVRPGKSITVFDVGQGDMVLVRDGPDALLVDVGPNANAAREVLARAGVRRLDALVLTHAHEDHIGGLSALGGVVQAEDVCAPAGSLSEQFGMFRGAGRFTVLKAGDRFRIGEITVDVVSPQSVVDDPAENDASVVLLVRYVGFSALLTGDAESVELARAVSLGRLEDVDVIKIGHHGSDGSLSESLLQSLRPEVAMISVGADNDFGHPHASTLEQLAHAGVRTLRTDLNGDVTVRFDDSGYRIETARDGSGPLACEKVGAVRRTVVLGRNP